MKWSNNDNDVMKMKCVIMTILLLMNNNIIMVANE